MTEKTLVIAEKPSVAGDIARALAESAGVFAKRQDYFENDDYVISSAVGHLLEMVPPDGVEVQRGKWSLTNLPVLPDEFALRPIKANEGRLNVLARLYRREDVANIINACDAGREGELIFFNIVRYLSGRNVSKPVRRLWLSSMTPAAIRKGFDQLKTEDEVTPLRESAESRAKADWLVGVNATRAMTALHSTQAGFFLTTVGRVQTPTLALMVEREREIKAFVPQTYWEVRANFAVARGEYEGVWVNQDKKAARPERIFDHAIAEQVLAACEVGAAARATETVKPASESAPPLLDLTLLQREANKRFGLPAKATLAAAQNLYEKHKLITYPRTDSRYLPEDYPAVVKKTLRKLQSEDQLFGKFATKALDNQWVVAGNRRIFNNAKVSDHFAIIPTGMGAQAKNLQDIDRKVYQFIVTRFIAAFFPPAKYLVTERRTVCGEHCFLTRGRVMQEAGWREVERAAGAAAGKDKNAEPPITAIAPGGEDATIAAIDSEQKETKPPARYTEATLLAAMESAGKFTDDEELREAMREKGLGTPATRAGIIEKLVHEKYIVRDMRNLKAMPKADSLIRLLSALKVDSLTKPALTGEWERKLRQIEKAEIPAAAFMREINELTVAIVAAAKDCGDVEKVEGDFVALNAPCPMCGGTVMESHRRFSCKKCDFFVWKTMSGRELAQEEVETLLANGDTGLLEGFRSRLGRDYAAKVILQKDEKGQLRAAFGFEQDDGASISDMSEEEIEAKTALGRCPKCGNTVREFESAYNCENGQCDFKITRRILQQQVDPAQIRKLLEEGKTDVMPNFVSKRTGRAFKARLVLDLMSKEGAITFEFEASRKFKGAKKSAAKKKAGGAGKAA